MRHEVKNLHSFLGRIAHVYLVHGYFRYAVREIPKSKDPVRVESTLVESYGMVRCRTARMRRRSQGQAVVSVVRLHHTFVLVATEGKHTAFDRISSYDFRTTPLHFGGYSVGIRRHKPCVEVADSVWSEVERRFQKVALQRKELVEQKLAALPYYQFLGVQRQKQRLLQAVNLRRKKAGLPCVVLA